MKIHKIRVESFEVYGLNKYKNFLDGDELTMNSVESVMEWAGNLLSEDETINNLAIFIQAMNDSMYAVTKEVDEDKGEYYIFNYVSQDNLDFFAQLDADYNFAYYALLMQLDKTTWKIIHF